ncbi:hypothetical protein [Parvularcula marina]|uniref:tellurite resistance TerB family protein n=1 Tax=Parvularcula marina TaxID=2292771 RepID=UPI0035180485
MSSTIEIARELADRVAGRPVPASPRPINLPDQDVEEEFSDHSFGYAEGQSFIIEYVDAASNQSTRRITVFDITVGRNGTPCLMAKCHERNATRQFRIDRIQCCIDYDGVVYSDVAAFLAENFGMSMAIAGRSNNQETDDRWASLLTIIKPDAVLLSAMMRADDMLREVEIECASTILGLMIERNGIFIQNEEVQTIARYVSRLRPTEKALTTALENVRTRPNNEIIRTLQNTLKIVDCDGERHPDELALMNKFCRELTGVPLQ